jgi:glycosyltransferase involved in cell wall biosynthesis
MSTLPLVSILIPCRNERKYIGECLESILKQDYPKEKMEVLVIDGASEDGTREIIQDYSKKYPFIRIINNQKKFTNFAWNLGIKESRGEILILVGAHGVYKKDYVLRCVKYIEEYNADNVGGTIITLPRENTLVAKAIALVLSSSFGVGGATFRKGFKKPIEGEDSKPSSSLLAVAREVDTVFGGCYRREVFERIGLLNENLNRGQDMEFNIRLKKGGGKILLVPDIVAYYYPKTANLKDFFIYHLKDGIWAVLPLKFVKTPFKLRHYLPLIFILTLPLSIWPYILVSLFFSSRIAFREKDFRLFFVMPLAFFCRHFGYGLGSIFGLIKLVLPVK